MTDVVVLSLCSRPKSSHSNNNKAGQAHFPAASTAHQSVMTKSDAELMKATHNTIISCCGTRNGGSRSGMEYLGLLLSGSSPFMQRPNDSGITQWVQGFGLLDQIIGFWVHQKRRVVLEQRASCQYTPKCSTP
jgi:hypothetical protein